MAGPPGGKSVTCPKCGNIADAIVPRNSRLVEEEEKADGKVWVNCYDCGNRFIVYYELV